MKKRLLSFALALVLALSVSVTVFADLGGDYTMTGAPIDEPYEQEE